MTSDIQSIISQMTPEEKAALCTGARAWTTTRVGHFGIPEMIVADGP
jgi:beta-glucosidase